MNNFKSFFAAAAMVLFVAFSASAQCSGHTSNTSYNEGHAHTAGDIVDIAASSDDFSTLVTAVKAAGLVDALKADGPITVFAPTNAAFGKVPAKTLNSLLEPENKEKLTAVLTYHVIGGSFDSDAVLKAIETGGGKAEIKTLNGQVLTAMVKDGHVKLKDANGNTSTVTKTDVKASNGYIHVIDTVVLP